MAGMRGRTRDCSPLSAASIFLLRSARSFELSDGSDHDAEEVSERRGGSQLPPMRANCELVSGKASHSSNLKALAALRDDAVTAMRRSLLPRIGIEGSAEEETSPGDSLERRESFVSASTNAGSVIRGFI